MSETVVKVLKITALCIVALLIVAALLYYVPWATPVDLTLNATKLDEAGNVLGTEEIHIKGHRLDYLFRDSRLVVDIEPFDTMKWTKLNDTSNGTGSIFTRKSHTLNTECYYVNFGAWDTGVNDIATGELFFNEDFDPMVFWYRPFGNKACYYIASVSGNYSTQEIIQLFSDFVPGLSDLQ